MLRQLVKDTGIYGITGLISRAVSIFLIPFYTRVLSPSDYGIIDIIAVVAAIVSITVPLEMTQAVARFYADGSTLDENKIDVASTGLLFTLFAFLIFTLAWIFFAPWLAIAILGDSSLTGIMRVASLSMFANALYYFVQNQLRWRLEPGRYSIVSLFYTVTTIVITIWLVLIFKTGVIGVFWAQTIGGFAGFALGFYFSRSSYKFRFRLATFKEMLSFSAPLVPSSIGVFFLTYAQRIIIRAMIGLTALGLYGIGFRIASVVTLLMQAFQGAITPIIYSHYREESAPAEIARIFRIFVFFALLVFVAMSLFAREAVMILTAPAYHSVYIFVPFLVADQFLSGMYVFAPGLAIAKKTKYLAVINVCGAALSVLITILLVCWIGLLGAAIAAASKSLVLFMVQMKYSQKFYHVPHNYIQLVLSIISGVIFVALGFTTDKIFPLFLCAIFKCLLFFLCFTTLIFVGLVGRSEMFFYLKKGVNR
jgi:O-antigen/teichoic acid export membrane protein